jgi:hypothetical protein
VAAIGFGLTAYPIGVERGWVTREDARKRVLATLRFLSSAPQGPSSRGVTGYRGFFYHFLDVKTGERFETVELSTIDTTLLLAGVLLCQSYFDGESSEESEIRSLAESLYGRIEWDWAQLRPPLVNHGWRPDTGFLPHDWGDGGYDESMIFYVLALGSPTHPIAPEAWELITANFEWTRFYGQEYIPFNALFGHQYSHVWIDFRGIQDEYMRAKQSDYFVNSVRATYANRAYCIANPGKWKGYGELVWGLTASDGPGPVHADPDGTPFRAYWARAPGPDSSHDDGTLAPTAVGGSVPFAPEVAIPTLMHLRDRFGDRRAEHPALDLLDPCCHLKVVSDVVLTGSGPV